MSVFYLSFGQGHRHEIDGIQIDRDCLVRIYAANEHEARQIACVKFGEQWSRLYLNLPDLQFYPRGIVLRLSAPGMQNPKVPCPNCREETEHTIESMAFVDGHGPNGKRAGWREWTVQCSECELKHTVKP